MLKREIRDIERHDVRILATDIDTEVIARGARGEYPATSIDEVPRAYQEYFQPIDGGKGDNVIVDRGVRSLVAFKRLNLMEPWPFNGTFDAIFCRNVMIYFDGPTKAKLIERFTQKAEAGRLSLYRPFRIAERRRIPASAWSAARSTGGKREQRQRAAAADRYRDRQRQPVRRHAEIFRRRQLDLDGEGVSGRILRHRRSPTKFW